MNILTAVWCGVQESRFTDFTFDIWTPRFRWIPAQRMQTKMPIFHDAHLGPIIQRFRKINNCFFKRKVYSVSIQKRQSISSFFINEKSENIFYFFTCILPNYIPHKSSKEFWKNSHFKDMRAGFLLRCQESLRLITPWNDAFSAMKKKYSNHYHVLALDPIKQ